MNITKILPCMLVLWIWHAGVTYVAVSQVGLEMHSHITLLPLQNYNISGYLMIVFILQLPVIFPLSVILSTGTSSSFHFLIGMLDNFKNFKFFYFPEFSNHQKHMQQEFLKGL